MAVAHRLAFPPSKPGEVILDIGSGGGIDCFEASRKVGAAGKVIGIDMTDEMLSLARTHAPTVAKNLGYPASNVDFRKGFADAMPVEDNQVDLIISNCVINLAPDKKKVFREMFRVLQTGGRFYDFRYCGGSTNSSIHDPR